ncbi:MAG TPA: PH domain-containing protein [Anaerolineae bacterium]|nr:PH domain-containing protein [Anaerolineae bacterium]
MSNIEQIKIKARERIWKSLAQSQTPIASIPHEELETLVDALLDGIMVLIDESLEEAGLPGRAEDARSAMLESDEQLLWEGRPFLSLVTHYQITTERVRIIRGLLGKDRDDIELIRIQDIDLKQSMTERVLGVGDIVIRSADPSMPKAVLNNVKDPERVHEILRRAMLNARKRFRYSVQEEM